MSTENALLTILTEKINNDTLVLPTLPAIALKVRKTADDPDVNLSMMAEVISQDPALSARMIKIANSSYMGRAVKVDNLSQAVTRIGLRQIKNIATALAMEQLFVSKNDTVREYVNRVWSRTVDVVAHSLALLEAYTERTGQKALNLDSMTLAALVHNIGVLPIFTEAERHEDVFGNPAFLNAAVQKLAGRIGGSITRHWGFSEDFVNVAENWRNMKYQTAEPSYVDFVRCGAAVAGHIGSQKDTVLNLAQKKGLIDDLSILHSEEYEQRREAGQEVFA